MRISYWSSDVCSSDLEAVCKSVKFGVIVYNRNVCRLTPDSLAILADRCPNLIGFKDGIGDIELMSSIHLKLGERFSRSEERREGKSVSVRVDLGGCRIINKTKQIARPYTSKEL